MFNAKKKAGREYLGPKLKTTEVDKIVLKDKLPKQQNPPCFLGPDGQWYDKFYNPISANEMKNLVNAMWNDSNSHNNILNSDIFKKMPKPEGTLKTNSELCMQN